MRYRYIQCFTLKIKIMMNYVKSTICPLFLVLTMLLAPFNEAIGQLKEKTDNNKQLKTRETLIMGKKYNEVISEVTAKRISDKMEAIKSEFENANKGADIVHTDLKFIEDVNKLKALDFRPRFDVHPSKDLTFKILLELLKKYSYLDIMVTGYTPYKETAINFALPVANYLCENGISKSRLRVNGLSVICLSTTIYFDSRISLVPSKEMIDKAIEDKL